MTMILSCSPDHQSPVKEAELHIVSRQLITPRKTPYWISIAQI